MRMRLLPTLVPPALLALLLLSSSTSHAGGGDRATRRVYPNPFTEGTVFQLTMPKTARIKIGVYDMLGREVRVLYEGMHPEGDYNVPWDGKDFKGNPVIAGVYICVLFSEDVAVKSVKVIKVQA